MRPRVVHMITRVVFAGVVTNPDLAINVGCIGMAGFVAEVAIWLNSMRCTFNGSRSVRWRSLVPSIIRFFVLGKRRDRKNKQCGQC